MRFAPTHQELCDFTQFDRVFQRFCRYPSVNQLAILRGSKISFLKKTQEIDNGTQV